MDDRADNEPEVVREGVANYAFMTSQIESLQPSVGFEQGTNKPKKNRKNKRKRLKSKPSKWADKCMYAELLEMKEQPHFWADDVMEADDGLPSDLEQAWVAVAPVPVGKRCLAITHQSAAGIIGICEAIFYDLETVTLSFAVQHRILLFALVSWGRCFFLVFHLRCHR